MSDIRVITEESSAATDELIDRVLAADGTADVLVVADWHFPRDMEQYAPSFEVPAGDLEHWCHVITRPDFEQAVAGSIPEAARVEPTRSGFTRFHVRDSAHLVTRQLRGEAAGCTQPPPGGRRRDRPEGRFRCPACNTVWEGSQLIRSPYHQEPVWTCGDAFCGVIIRTC